MEDLLAGAHMSIAGGIYRAFERGQWKCSGGEERPRDQGRESTGGVFHGMTSAARSDAGLGTDPYNSRGPGDCGVALADGPATWEAHRVR